MSTVQSDLTKALVIHPALAGAADLRSEQARLEEAVGLAGAIDLEVAHAAVAPLHRPRPATYLGEGKVAEIAAILNARDPRPGLVVVDCALSPVQHRNLERAWNAKVLDRTALILEIFGARAQTAEGRLQVELAHLTYQRSRLVRSWTHLERQRGGRGFLGGPGERQIEADRRALADRIDRIKEKLDQVRRTRSLQRAKRKKAPHPVVALVGYTNAGKSTLFNRLTRAQVLAKDLLFATLDPTMRAITLVSGERVVLSDTVGFISDLPTQLVAAFRATLEEVLEADVIVHVRDASHIDAEAQRQDVLAVLRELGVRDEGGPPVIEALNKIDLLDAEEKQTLRAACRLSRERAIFAIDEPVRVAISAVTGEGVDELLSLIDDLATEHRETVTVAVPATDGAARARLYEISTVLSEERTDETALITVRIAEKPRGQFLKSFPHARLVASAVEQRYRA
ncbi:GTPase HflX [Amphiplicatus metriothermophilus]|uniref:GTPase HflX n=1 Tax=Amphiplicatus metriothermophilus TaxID=1519374 RepID=A0A239PX23_9PROT|nr:GTPase HflX [Amphiplicatus metriothermophilus]MBB5519968.1 GTP-binding protein HflX [Amphiplicatus metriothermophilus]SNT74869.1 GTP-binding protein HflX [Amphiplicatus metriothermophilus]